MGEENAGSAIVPPPKNWWRDSSLVERLKRDADLVGMIRSHGVDLRAQGADLVGLCPFHQENTPSFRLSPAKNLGRCFGCGKGGSAVDWIVAVSGCSIREAFDQLRIQQGVIDPGLTRARDWVSPEFAPDPDWDDDRLLRSVVDHYASRLESSPLGQEYLRRRGLWDPDLARRFRLGFADRTLGVSIGGTSATSRTRRLRERFADLGLMRETGHEHFTGCVVVPILDVPDGDNLRPVLGIYGRRASSCRGGMVPHLYLKGPHRGVFNSEGVRASGSDTVLLCESILDALTFVRWGFESATCAYGVRGMTPDLWAFLTESGFRRVVLAFDADAAGESASRDLAPRLHAEGLEVQRLSLPEGQDVNDLAVRSSDPARALQQAIDGAFWLSEQLYPDRPARMGKKTETVVLEPDAVQPPSSFAAPVSAAQTSAAGPVPPLLPPVVSASPEVAQMQATAPDPSIQAHSRPTHPRAEAVPSPALDGDSGTHDANFGDRSWRAKGLLRNRSDDVLRVTLRVTRENQGGFHLDTLDLYQAKSREAFARTSASELGLEMEVIRADLARLVVQLEERLRLVQQAAALPPEPERVTLSEAERSEALALLRRPDLLRQLLSDLEASGMVGEEGNKLLCWLSLTSRRLDSPLGLLIQSTSAAGKSSLLDGVLGTMPEEEVVRYSAMSGQALFYMGGVSLRHKILAVAEEEGARRASYSLKLLQSDGELSMASTTKDPDSGQLVTKEYRTQGPVALVMTTTSLDIDPELQNRCLVLCVDESREQTEAIHRIQRLGRTREGQLQRREAASRLAVWRNAQRLLEPLAVVNPYAQDLTFASHRTRTRRDMAKYLTLLEAVALAHQHQKPRRFDASGCFIEVDLDDVELANLLSVRGLGVGLQELSGPTERLLRALRAWVRVQSEKQGIEPPQVRFTRRDLSDCTPWSATQLKEHLRVLVEHEVLSVMRGKAGLVGSVQYQLTAWEEDPRASVGLLDVSHLRRSHPNAPYRGTWASGLPFSEGRTEVGRGSAGSENRPTPYVLRMASEPAQDAASQPGEISGNAEVPGSAGSAGESHIEGEDGEPARTRGAGSPSSSFAAVSARRAKRERTRAAA